MYYFIVNPIAGRGRMSERLVILLREFDAAGLPYESYTTQCPMDGFHKAREICEQKPDCMGIIGLGGDGTLQEIADGMHTAFPHGKIPVPLGIFPAGSGNDFVMSLLNGKKAALERYKKNRLDEAARMFTQSVIGKRIRTIDLPTANGAAYMNIANLGLDARIVRNALALKERWGRYAYIAAVYKSILRHSNVPLSIEADGKIIDDTFTLVAVCNGQYYGGGLHISPMADIADGKITLCLVRGMARPKTMVLFPSLMIARHTSLKTVSFMDCDEVKITLGAGAHEGEMLCMDGNLYPMTHDGERTVHFKIRPSALDVFV